MKKLAIVLAIAAATSSFIFAQVSAAPFGPPGYSQTQGQSVKIDGKLALINGVIGLKSGNKTYYVPMLGRLAGFIDGIKEGAGVKIEGYEYPFAAAPEYSMVMVTKLAVGGKDYDLGQFYGYGMGYGMRGGMMGGRHW
jgi:hypothetical protein